MLPVQSRDETLKHAVENIIITKTKKDMHVMSLSEDSAVLLSTIFIRFGLMQCLAVPKTEDHFEGLQIFRSYFQSRTCDNCPEEYYRIEVPEVFQAVKTPSQYVYWCARKLL